jgi:type IV pilus assembly protein PilX
MMRPHTLHRRRSQSGVALLTSLLILVIVSLVAVSMYRSYGTQEAIAGNTLEKQRALQAAESAVRYGEWWISQGNVGKPDPACTGTLDSATGGMRLCANRLLTPSNVSSWPGKTTYKPANMTVSTSGDLVGTSTTTGVAGDINYYQPPAVHIACGGVGPPPDKKVLYIVTGVGYAGRQSTTSVAQSVYAVASPPNSNLAIDYAIETSGSVTVGACS